MHSVCKWNKAYLTFSWCNSDCRHILW